MRTLASQAFTTQEISARLPDVPKSSIYRHLKTLLESNLVFVAETRQVRGIQEKRYRLTQEPTLGPGDMAGLDADEHLGYFTSYLLTMVRDFSNYLAAAEQAGRVDMLADRVGYTEVTFEASRDELDSFQAELNRLVLKLKQIQTGTGRKKRKLAIVTHPIQQ